MDSILIKNGTIVDCESKELVENCSILIENGLITDLGSNSYKKNTKIIDAKGKFIIPGFIDTHTHVMTRGFNHFDTYNDSLSLYFYKAVENLKKTLYSGITTTRDAGLADIGVKMAINQGIINAPNLKITIMPLSITGGHFDLKFNSGFDMRVNYSGLPSPICDGVEGVLRKTREMLRAKADFIKVMATGGVLSINDSPDNSQFNLKELKTIVSEANNSDKKVMAHAHGLKGIKNVISAGVHSIEHGTYIDKTTANKMAKKGIYLAPTFHVMDQIAKYAENGVYTKDIAEKALNSSKIHKENMQIAYDAGVKFTLGSDCGVTPHGENLMELKFFTDLGMDPFEAIAIGTINSGQCLGILDEYATISIGKKADLIISNKNPIEDINSLADRNNFAVIKSNNYGIDIIKNNNCVI